MYLKLCSPAQLKEMYSEFNITDESLEKDTKYLMQWLEQTPHLPKIKDKETLTRVLFACKNSLESAKTYLDYYYSYRSMRQKQFFFRNPCCDEIKEALKWLVITPLPKLTSDGCRIIVVKSIQNESEKLPSANSLLSSYQLQLEVITKNDMNKGFIVIGDYRDISFALCSLIAQDLRGTVEVMQKTTKMRWKRFVLLSPDFFKAIITLAKGLMSKKIADRMEFWDKEPEKLAEIFPKDVLPSTYGGTEEPIDVLKEQWCKYFYQFSSWFKAEESVNADLSKRPKDDLVDMEFSTIGVDGSFRKLTTD